jgi:hypothetical protein
VSTLTATGRVDVRTHTFGGTAICDFFDAMQADLVDFQPNVVVMVYSGNAMTPCMDEAPGGSDDYYERYHADADAVMAMYEPLGVRVYWVGTPVTRAESEAHDSSWSVLNLMYSELADHHTGAFYVDAGQAVMRGGEYTDFLPCLPTEPCVGMPDPVTGEPSNRVRGPDGTHFCPVQVERGSTTGCPVWSSGAWRFGITMADPIVRDFGLRPTSAR